MTSDCDPVIEAAIRKLESIAPMSEEKKDEIRKFSKEKLKELTEDPPDPPVPGDEAAKKAVEDSKESAQPTEEKKRASTIRFDELTPKEQISLIDMLDQDFLTLQASRELMFDPSGSIRVAVTPKKNDEGKPIVHIASPSTEIGKDIIARMGKETFVVVNLSTNRFALEDLTDRRLLEAKESPKEKAPGSAKEPEAKAEKKEVKD